MVLKSFKQIVFIMYTVKPMLKNVNLKLFSVLLFMSAGSLMFLAMPSAMAISGNSPSITTSPLIPAVGGTMSVVITAGAAGDLPHIQGIVRVYEPLKSPGTIGGTFPTDCDFGTTAVATGGALRKVIEFRQAIDTTLPNRYTMAIGSSGNTLTIPVASGTVIPTPDTGITLDDPTGGVWIVVEGSGSGLPASIDYLTAIEGAPYRAATCGYDGGGSTSFPYDVKSTTATQQPVGGTVIPIDMTSLAIAGLMTQQTGILAGLVVIGLAVTTVKLFVLKPKLN